MINIEQLSDNTLKARVSGKIGSDDFSRVGTQVEPLMKRSGSLRLLIDATGFEGWDSMAAFERHIRFVREHQQKLERLAVLASHDWQRWVIGTISVFVHPEVRTFDQAAEAEAREWLGLSRF